MGNVTMRDIGRRVGVSAVTVSKALAGKSGVSEAMRQRITKVAAEMGYVNPNAAHAREARGLDVGILIPDRFFAPESFYAMLYKLLVRTLTEAGHFGLLELLSAETERSLALPNLMRSRRADALILLGQPRETYARMITRQGVPVVLLDFYDAELAADAVVGDNAAGTALLTEHLIAQGHRDIGFVGDVKAISAIMERYLGFCSAMLRHDLPVRGECVLRDRDERGAMGTLRFPEKLPTALVCNCDLVARETIRQLRERGLRVPEDVSIVGYDDFDLTPAEAPTLTTFRVDRQAMCRAAVTLLENRCADGCGPVCRVVVGGKCVCRDSVRPIGGAVDKAGF